MSLKEVANANLGFSHDAIAAQITNNSTPSTKVKAVGAGIFFGALSISLSLVQTAIITDGNGTGSGNINPTALKVASSGQIAMRKDDQAVIPVTGTAGGSPVADVVTVTINNSGQTKVKAQ